jgi:hypothetical protein
MNDCYAFPRRTQQQQQTYEYTSYFLFFLLESREVKDCFSYIFLFLQKTGKMTAVGGVSTMIHKPGATLQAMNF